jgi:hypothetical protein
VTSLDTILQRFGVTGPELSGAALSGEIPLSNTVVNRFIAAQLARRNGHVSSVRLRARNGDEFEALILPKARFVPPIRIVARVERQPDLPGDPVLRLRWSMPGMGALALFAAPAFALFNALPPGVRADGDRIAIDVRELLVSRGLGELAGYLRGLRVHTREDAFIVRFDVRVPEPAGTTDAS